MICEDGKCNYDTVKQEVLPVPDGVPALYEDLFTLDEYRQLVANSRLLDTQRQAVLQLKSPTGAKPDRLVCPVAIKPIEPEWIVALVVFPDGQKNCRASLVDIKIGTLKKWRLVRYTNWAPSCSNVADMLEEARMYFN